MRWPRSCRNALFGLTHATGMGVLLTHTPAEPGPITPLWWPEFPPTFPRVFSASEVGVIKSKNGGGGGNRGPAKLALRIASQARSRTRHCAAQ